MHGRAVSPTLGRLLALSSQLFSRQEGKPLPRRVSRTPKRRAAWKASCTGLLLMRRHSPQPLAQLSAPLLGLAPLARWVFWKKNPRLSRFLDISPDNSCSRDETLKFRLCLLRRPVIMPPHSASAPRQLAGKAAPHLSQGLGRHSFPHMVCVTTGWCSVS